jgi:hypothetical protein
MAASNDTVREIAKVLRRDIDQATLERVVNDLLEVRAGQQKLPGRDRDAGARSRTQPAHREFVISAAR